MPDPKDKMLFDELLKRRSVTIPRLMSDQPLDEQAVPDQMLTGLWNGVIGNPTDAPVAAKIGAAWGEINPLNDLRTLDEE